MRHSSDPLDALNDYLDELAGAQRPEVDAAGLEPSLRRDVDRFFDLAWRASMTPATPRSARMNVTVPTTSVLPPSTRSEGPASRTGTLTSPPQGGRLNVWLSAALVTLMLLGMVGGAWWFGANRGDPPDGAPLHLAAITPDEGTPGAIWPEPLTVDEAPWIAPIRLDECTAEPLPYTEYAEAKTTNPGPPQGSYEIVGVPEQADAEEVVTVLRAWMACFETGNTGKIRAFYTSENLFFTGFSAENAPYQDELDQQREDAARQFTLWARDTDLYPLSVVSGIEPPAEAVEIFAFAQAVLDGEETYISPEQTPVTYFEARYDPADAVLLADGRIMIPTRYIYWDEDPWLQEYGMPDAPNTRTMALILENVDGAWKIDENATYMCFGECDDVLNGLPATPIATPDG